MLPIEIAVPTRYPALVTYALIAANGAVFLFQVSLSPGELQLFLSHFALVPARYFAAPPGVATEGCSTTSPSQQHVPARRLAAPGPQHVDAVPVRPGH